MSPTGAPRIRTGLAGLATLLTAASAMSAGVTTTGLALRVGVAAAGFWVLGAVVERVCVPTPDEKAPSPRSGKSPVGRALSVTIPAAEPDPPGDEDEPAAAREER